jgi:hypothetical protein
VYTATASSIGVFHVFPNPAGSYAKIMMNMVETHDVAINLVDITGKTIAEVKNGKMTKGEHFITVDLTNVPAGLYMIHAATADGVKSAKLNVVK